MKTCLTCGRAIRWGMTVGGSRMPIDPTPSFGGTVYITSSGKFRVLTQDEVRRGRAAGALLYTEHHTTCKGAGRHRVPRAQGAFDV